MTYAELIRLCHDNAHDAAHDIEDTLFVAMTRRDVWTYCLGLILVDLALPCLKEQSAETRVRLVELVDVQKDDWREAPPS